MEKKMLAMFGMFLLIAILIPSVSAEFWACFEENEVINFCNPNIPDRTCGSDLCKFCMSAYVDADGCYSPGSFNKCNAVGGACSEGNGVIDVTPPVITFNNPTQNSLHTDDVIELDLDVNEDSQVRYKNLDDSIGRWTNLCDDCRSINRDRRFDEGLNRLRFSAEDRAGNDAFFDITFFVDSKKPRISKTSPTKGFIGSPFGIEFKEENPVELMLHYGNLGPNGFKEHEADIDSECEIVKGKHKCVTEVSLKEYDGEVIEYWFVLEDIVGNVDESKHYFLIVDETFPLINDIDFEIDGKNVFFEIDVTELNLDEVGYIDNDDPRLRERRLCTKLVDGKCMKKASFKDGAHDVTIYVLDEAGHMTGLSIGFFTDSKDPRITGVEPKGKFTNGTFIVEFGEANPTELTLHYGNVGTGFLEHDVDIENDCELVRSKFECITSVNLELYNEEVIDYWFVLEDIIGQTDESRIVDVIVDVVPPVINDIVSEQDGNNVEFVIDIAELNFEEIEYFDHGASRPRWKRMCSRLDDGICEDRITLREIGPHSIDLRVWDEAGNSYRESDLEFLVG